MKYRSTFASINDVVYTVEIETKRSTGIGNITLTGEPFSVQYKSQSGNLYKPVKYSGATCTILSNQYDFNLFSGEAQGVSVKLLKGEELLWTGYLTPNVYDQNFDEYLEEIELECIDGLSTLKYVKFTSENKGIVTFKKLIDKLLGLCNCYSKYYVPFNLRHESDSINHLIEDCVVSEALFFNKKKGTETDDELSWKCDAVLEELCKYLNLTALAKGDSVYFVDYDEIKLNNGVQHYLCYTLGSSSQPEEVYLGGLCTINANSYAESSTSISLENVYNKVSVKDEFQTFDNIFADPFENLINITASSDPEINLEDQKRGGWGEIIQSNQGNVSGNTNLEVLVNNPYIPEDNKYSEDINYIAVKYCKSDLCTLYSYNNSNTQITYPYNMNFTDSKTFRGGILAKMVASKLDPYKLMTWEEIFEWLGNYHNNWGANMDKLLSQNEVSISLSNYICLFNPTNSTTPDNILSQRPYVKFNAQQGSSLFGGENAYIVISGSYCFHLLDDSPYPVPENEVDIKQGRYKIWDASNAYLLCRL